MDASKFQKELQRCLAGETKRRLLRISFEMLKEVLSRPGMITKMRAGVAAVTLIYSYNIISLSISVI